MRTTPLAVLLLVFLLAPVPLEARTLTREQRIAARLAFHASILPEETMLRLLNAERKKHGLQELRLQSALTSAAQGHADDMQKRKYFSHENPEGLSPSDRAKQAGYVPPTCRGCRWEFIVAENIARGQKTVESVVRAWLQSAGHRRNILNPKLRDFGAAQSGNVWVQMFGLSAVTTR